MLSIDPEIMYLSSKEKETDKTSLWSPLRRCKVLKLFKSQSLQVLSHDPETKNFESLEMAKDDTKCECPDKSFFGFPTVNSLSYPSFYSTSPGLSRLRFHKMIFLSLDPEITNGCSLASLPTTMEVTIPL